MVMLRHSSNIWFIKSRHAKILWFSKVNLQACRGILQLPWNVTSICQPECYLLGVVAIGRWHWWSWQCSGSACSNLSSLRPFSAWAWSIWSSLTWGCSSRNRPCHKVTCLTPPTSSLTFDLIEIILIRIVDNSLINPSMIVWKRAINDLFRIEIKILLRKLLHCIYQTECHIKPFKYSQYSRI